jgi:hypothetical protein
MVISIFLCCSAQKIEPVVLLIKLD